MGERIYAKAAFTALLVACLVANVGKATDKTDEVDPASAEIEKDMKIAEKILQKMKEFPKLKGICKEFIAKLEEIAAILWRQEYQANIADAISALIRIGGTLANIFAPSLIPVTVKVGIMTKTVDVAAAAHGVTKSIAEKNYIEEARKLKLLFETLFENFHNEIRKLLGNLQILNKGVAELNLDGSYQIGFYSNMAFLGQMAFDELCKSVDGTALAVPESTKDGQLTNLPAKLLSKAISIGYNVWSLGNTLKAIYEGSKNDAAEAIKKIVANMKRQMADMTRQMADLEAAFKVE